MAVAGPSNALEQIAGREAQLARWLHAQFRRRLTADDARDAVADALVSAHAAGAELQELDAERLMGWVRTRAYRNAIDQIRAIDGYGAERRKASVDIDDYAETLGDGAGEDESVFAILDDELAAHMDGAAAASVARALERLTPDERRLLRLRHYDGLDVKTIAALLDIHPKKYERLHTRAIAKLRTIFIETTASEHCAPVRELIARSRGEGLAPGQSAAIAAHVEACAQCHAYEKRSLKLIALLPLPAPAFADRFWARLQELMPGVSQHGEAVAGTGAAAAGGGGAAGTGLVAGIGAKTAALCGGAAVTATCVGAIALPAIKHEPSKPARAAPSAQTAPAATLTPARSTTSTTPRRTASATKKKTKTASSGSRKVTGSIGVEDFGTPTGGGAASQSAPAPPPPPPPPPPASFTGEFTP